MGAVTSDKRWFFLWAEIVLLYIYWRVHSRLLVRLQYSNSLFFNPEISVLDVLLVLKTFQILGKITGQKHFDSGQRKVSLSKVLILPWEIPTYFSSGVSFMKTHPPLTPTQGAVHPNYNWTYDLMSVSNCTKCSFIIDYYIVFGVFITLYFCNSNTYELTF